MPTALELLDQGLAKLRSANRIDGSRSSYRKDSPNEYAAVMSYLAGGSRPANVVTDMGVGLTLAEDARRKLVVVPEPEPEPEPSPVGAHFVSDWRDGLIGYKAGQFDAGYPWATIFSHTSPGYQDVGLYGQAPRVASADGRVAVVDNPYGSGKVLRCEIRDSDPGWPSSTALQKSEIGSVEAPTCGGAFVLGMELWLSMDLYLPDEYGLATGGSNAYNVLCDLHPQSNSGIPGVGIVTYGGSNSIKGQFGIGTTYRPVLFALDAAHRHRKIPIVLGMKLAPNGWVEAWVDGVNVVPRLTCVTAETSEQGPYWKQGLYKQRDAVSPGGKQIAFYGRTLIGRTRASVGA